MVASQHTQGSGQVTLGFVTAAHLMTEGKELLQPDFLRSSQTYVPRRIGTASRVCKDTQNDS